MYTVSEMRKNVIWATVYYFEAGFEPKLFLWNSNTFNSNHMNCNSLKEFPTISTPKKHF